MEGIRNTPAYMVAERAARRSWAVTIVVVSAVVAVMGALFWREGLGAYRVWVGSTAYNHCFLVLPLVGYLIWERRTVLLNSTPRPEFKALVLIPFLSMLWFLTATLGVLEAQQFVAMTLLQAALLSLLGWPAYKRLLAPLLYLYFLVPSGEFLVPALQDFTAAFVVKGLHLFGVPVYSDGVFIEVRSGRFLIAEECAGIRFLIASVAFGTFYAIVMYQSRWKRAAFVALSIVVPILANGVRAFGIVYAAELIDSATAATADHVIYGWGFFSAILVGLILLGRSFADRGEQEDVATERFRGKSGLAPAALAGFLSIVLASVGPIYASSLDRVRVPDTVALGEPPAVGAPWRRAEAAEADWTPIAIGPDRVFADAFTDGRSTVYRFVALYVARGRTNNLVRSQNRIADGVHWSMAVQGAREAKIGGSDRSLEATEIVSRARRRLVFSFYVVDGTITSDPLTAKLRQAAAVMTGGERVSAFVAVATDFADGGPPPAEVLTRFLGATEPLPRYVTALWP